MTAGKDRSSGENMFNEISRCWKCRFVHHYNVNVGLAGAIPQGAPEIPPGVVVLENPRLTKLHANGPLGPGRWPKRHQPYIIASTARPRRRGGFHVGVAWFFLLGSDIRPDNQDLDTLPCRLIGRVTNLNQPVQTQRVDSQGGLVGKQ
jgi:hypothetical protein